jgi:acyl carrier protein
MDAFLTNSGSPDTIRRIRRVFVESLQLNLSEQELEYGSNLDELAGMDSVAVIEFVAALEKEFGITLEVEMLQLEFIRDLDELAPYIDQRVARHAGPQS